LKPDVPFKLPHSLEEPHFSAVDGEDGTDEDEEISEGDVRLPPNNPILWFTALPPQPLRNAQRNFEYASEIAAKLARNQSLLLKAEKEWQRLKHSE